MRETPEFLTETPAVTGADMDALVETLRVMRLTGAIFLEAELSAPWSLAAQVGPDDCAAFTTVPRHIIAYHLITEGRCLLKVANHPEVSLSKGDIVILPRNDAHVLASGLDLAPVDAGGLIEPNAGGGVARIRYGGDGESTRLFCGFLGSDVARQPLLAALPTVVTLNVGDGAAGAWIASTFQFAITALNDRTADVLPMLAKVAELLFIVAVRQYAASASATGHGWLAAIHDPVVGRALNLLHTQLARRWTTEALAREAALSRSAFAERFTRMVGEAPMRYLTQCRFERAILQLRESPDSISRIAFDVGYDSEAAFSRAFRREFGMPPTTWRQQNAGGDA